MADYPPFMNAYGSIPKILEKIKAAATPPRFTQDFLSTKLGFKGGSYKPFLSLAKRLGLLSSDGVPTDLYRRFRNETESKSAIAAAMRRGYSQLFERNEYADRLKKEDLEGLVTEITGIGKGNNTLKAICNTFGALKKFADFELQVAPSKPIEENNNGEQSIGEEIKAHITEPLKFNLAYTINLVLPKTEDIAVFNAIFKSLKHNLLNK